MTRVTQWILQVSTLVLKQLLTPGNGREAWTGASANGAEGRGKVDRPLSGIEN